MNSSLVEHSGGLALRQGEWKFIPRRPGPKRAQFTDTDTGNNDAVQLYNLADNLGETKNLAAALLDKVTELQKLLEAERAKNSPPPPGANKEKAATKEK